MSAIAAWFKKILGIAEQEAIDFLEHGKALANGALATFEVLIDELEDAIEHFDFVKEQSAEVIANAETAAKVEIALIQKELAIVKVAHEARQAEADAAATQAATAASRIKALIS